MDMDKIIELVTQEVLKRLKNEISKIKNKKILLLNYDEKSKVLIEEKLKNYEIATEIEDLNDIDYILAASMDNKLLYNLSIGKEDNNSKILIEGIFIGKKILVLEENIFYKKFKETCNENFYKVFENQEEKVKSYGVVIGSLGDIKNILLQEENPKQNIINKIVNSKEEINYNKEIDFTKIKLINQFHIKDIREEIDCILLDKKSILTPLAKDYIRERNISVKRV